MPLPFGPRVADSWQIVDHSCRIVRVPALLAIGMSVLLLTAWTTKAALANASALQCGGYATKHEPHGVRPIDRQAALRQILRARTGRRLHETEGATESWAVTATPRCGLRERRGVDFTDVGIGFMSDESATPGRAIDSPLKQNPAGAGADR